MKTSISITVLLFTLAMMLCSCEKVVFEDQENNDDILDEGEVRVTLNVARMGDGTSFGTTRAVVNAADYCSRINFVIYQNGTKLQAITQTADDEDFGTVSVTLQVGETYQLLVLAHSGLANPSPLSKPEALKFGDKTSGYSDTFYYYGDLVVSQDDLDDSHELTLDRATSLFRLIVTDAIPNGFNTMRLHYTGGSGTFNAITGYGCVNSTQNVWYDTTEGATNQVYEAYTFLHADEGLVTFQVSFYSSVATKERTFTDVPMKRNRITQYTGEFFKDEENPNNPDNPDNPNTPVNTDNNSGFSFKMDTDWEGVDEYTF